MAFRVQKLTSTMFCLKITYRLCERIPFIRFGKKYGMIILMDPNDKTMKAFFFNRSKITAVVTIIAIYNIGHKLKSIKV